MMRWEMNRRENHKGACPLPEGNGPHLYPAWAVPWPLPLAGREHGDHFVQASLQTAENFPRLPLLPTVHLTPRHVQRARPGDESLVTHPAFQYLHYRLSIPLSPPSSCLSLVLWATSCFIDCSYCLHLFSTCTIF